MTKLSKCISALCIIISVLLITLLLTVFLVSSGNDNSHLLEASKPAIMSKFEMYIHNSSAEALNGIVPIKKHYFLPEDTVVAPEPDQSLFGAVDTPDELESVITEASELLEGQSTLFAADTDILPGTQVRYYLDDTILAITWKQVIDGRCYTLSEVKLADASQFRRYLADNSFGSGVKYRPSDMATTVNAVVAISGDFYAFRDLGIVVYQRELYRVRGRYMDNLFVDSKGDFHFIPKDTMFDEETAKTYIKENDILFSLAFGPILVDNGVNVAPGSYVVGEIDDYYSRGAIAQLGDKHYLLVSVNRERPNYAGITVRELAATLANIGCQKAYALDGGQTVTIIMNDEVINNSDYGSQRQISDIVYFATAIPD